MQIGALWAGETGNGEWCMTGTIDIPEGMSITLEAGTKVGVFLITDATNERAPQARLVVLKPSRKDAPAAAAPTARSGQPQDEDAPLPPQGQRRFPNSTPPASQAQRSHSEAGGQSYRRQTPEPEPADEFSDMEDPFAEDETRAGRGQQAGRVPAPRQAARRAPGTNF